MKKRKIIILTLILILFGCSSNSKNEMNNEEDAHSEIIEEEKKDINFDNVDAVYSDDETYIKKGTELACIIESDIRMRDNPNGNLITEQYNGKEYVSHIPMQCYKVNDIVTDENYSWLNVDIENSYLFNNGITNVWVGTTPEWSTWRISGDDDCKYELNERKEYKEGGTNSSYLIENAIYSKSTLDRYFEMDEKGYDICMFLYKTMPGLNWSVDEYYVNFDSRNPSEEAKQSILSQIVKYGISGYQIKDDNELFKNIYDKFYAINLLNITANEEKYVNAYNYDEVYNEDETKEQWAERISNNQRLYLREHIDYYTEKTYGTQIDFTTAAMYDCENQLYVLNEVFWGSTSLQIPFVLDYKTEENVITVDVALVEIDGDNFICAKGSGISDASLFNNYILNEAPKCVCVLNVDASGNYQLITSQLLN